MLAGDLERIESPSESIAPSNRSRKRFRFSAPLGPGPFRGPFFCAGHPLAAGHTIPSMATHPTPPDAERLIRGIMLAILAWGVIHAIGAWTLNHDARRPLMVLACVFGFLGFWLAMLAVRRRRLAGRE